MNATTKNSDISPASGPRVMPDQRRAFGGVWRLTVWQFLSCNHLLTVAGMTAFLGFLAWRFSTSRLPGAYLEWVMEFFLPVVVPVLGFLSGAGAMRDQMKSSATDYVFTRPVRRWSFVAFKYVAHMACTQVCWLPAFAVIVGFALRRGGGIEPIYAGVLFVQMLMLCAFMAFGFLCAVLTKRYLVIGIIYGVIVEVGVGSIPAPLSRLSLTRQMREILQPVADGIPGVSFAEVIGTSGSIFLFCTACVGLAALLFSHRELMGERAGD